MRPRTTISIALALCAAALVCAVISQANQISDLREDQRKLIIAVNMSTAPEKPSEQNAPVASKGSNADQNELLRLRNEVNQLTRRKRELASVAAENARLQAQVASASTNTSAGLPAGYIRRTTARNAGFATPEATLETFLWAAQNQDEKAFLETLTPEAASRIRSGAENTGRSVSSMLKEATSLPGFRIVDAKQVAPNQLNLMVEVMPGTDPAPFPIIQIDGQWKLKFNH